MAIPSFYDGLPNVLVEAAALGVPMVASRAGGMADVLEDGETAFLFDPGDEAALRVGAAARGAAGGAGARRWARRAGRSPSASSTASSRDDALRRGAARETRAGCAPRVR